MFQTSLTLFLVISSVLCDNYATFRFANHYADHMVLQRSPQRAFLWGYSDTYTTISVSVKHTKTSERQTYHTKTFKDSRGFIAWEIALEPYKAGGPYDIICKSNVGGETIRLRDILFGDVWFCSGQSNMVFPTSSVRLYFVFHLVRFFARVRTALVFSREVCNILMMFLSKNYNFNV
ncbi:sialate O-acetylesterase-like [Hydractinia symbiolongicarpus]|uniref:sialate O-acetylesterase-like n=1 Tax=Hydractinia symbiolongicarpus TaxID=13093 RepID=UPI002551C1AF|nr:sialate O-acetylesterase-like [Hydractinia symbiolongicarpus]